MVLRRILQDTVGATAMEYCLIAAFIAIVIVASVQNIGYSVKKPLTNAANSMVVI